MNSKKRIKHSIDILQNWFKSPGEIPMPKFQKRKKQFYDSGYPDELLGHERRLQFPCLFFWPPISKFLSVEIPNNKFKCSGKSDKGGQNHINGWRALSYVPSRHLKKWIRKFFLGSKSKWSIQAPEYTEW